MKTGFQAPSSLVFGPQPTSYLCSKRGFLFFPVNCFKIKLLMHVMKSHTSINAYVYFKAGLIRKSYLTVIREILEVAP